MPDTIYADSIIGTAEPFATEEDFVSAIRKWRQQGLDADAQNRDRGIDDGRHAAGYQWDAADFAWRRQNNIPAMTFNLLPTLIRRRLAARSRRRIGPKVSPLSPGARFEGIAMIREGLMRNIDRMSNIDRIDNIVSMNQLTFGISHYEVVLEYADSDVFDNNIVIKTDRNPWSVIFDPLATDPTGADARWGLKETVMSRDEFKRAYPNAVAVDIGTNPGEYFTLPFSGRTGAISTYIDDWITVDTIRVALVWTMHTRKKRIALMTNGDVIEINKDVDPAEVVLPMGPGGLEINTIVIDPKTGEYKVREADVRYARATMTNGLEILSKQQEYPIDRIPLIRVPGWEIQSGNNIDRFSMITFSKDAVRFNNYVRSDRIEKIVYANRAQYEVQEDALSVEQERTYRNAHKMRGGILKYRGVKPEQVKPPIVDQSSIIETESAVKSIYEILDVPPGISTIDGNMQSGVVLEQQIAASDSGGQIYDDNFVEAKREVYRVVNQLINIVYDAFRVEKIVGSDGKIQDAILNDPENPEGSDITMGKYSIDTSIGPSRETQRAQAIDFIQTMVNAQPELMGVVAPDLIKLMNISGTEEIEERLRKARGDVDEESPEAQAAAQQAAQMAQIQMQMEMRAAELELAKKEADVQAKMADVQAKMAAAASEQAQGAERASKAQQNIMTSEARMAEMEQRIQLLTAQTEKVYAEIMRIMQGATQ